MLYCLLAACAIVGTSAHAGHQQLMRGTPLDTPRDLQKKFSTAFAGVFKAPAQDGAARTDQPVSAQIEDEKIDEFKKKLSPGCSKRFASMMNGNRPQTSSFDAHGGVKEGKKQCDKLEGKLCFTSASITESQKAPDGRKLAQQTAVNGHSCVPFECTERSDLTSYSQFMRQQTKNLMPGDSMKIALHVDCSKSGGSVASIDGDGKTAPEQAQQKSGACSVFYHFLPATIAVALATLL